jgi:hypothetical protein
MYVKLVSVRTESLEAEERRFSRCGLLASCGAGKKALSGNIDLSTNPYEEIVRFAYRDEYRTEAWPVTFRFLHLDSRRDDDPWQGHLHERFVTQQPENHNQRPRG